MNLEDYFRGLSDPTRLRIVNLLFHEELCGCEIQWLLGITQPLASRHLLYLKRSGLVVDRRDGFRVFYRLVKGNRLRDLFNFLRRAFHEQQPFGPDVARLRIVLAKGRTTRPRVQAATGRQAHWLSKPSCPGEKFSEETDARPIL